VLLLLLPGLPLRCNCPTLACLLLDTMRLETMHIFWQSVVWLAYLLPVLLPLLCCQHLQLSDPSLLRFLVETACMCSGQFAVWFADVPHHLLCCCCCLCDAV
jgi:hypothetical protein